MNERSRIIQRLKYVQYERNRVKLLVRTEEFKYNELKNEKTEYHKNWDPKNHYRDINFTKDDELYLLKSIIKLLHRRNTMLKRRYREISKELSKYDAKSRLSKK